MFFFSTGERVPLVTTPTGGGPTCTHSPCAVRLVARELEPDELPLRMRAPLGERLSCPTKSPPLFFGCTVKPMPGLEGIDLVV